MHFVSAMDFILIGSAFSTMISSRQFVVCIRPSCRPTSNSPCNGDQKNLGGKNRERAATDSKSHFVRLHTLSSSGTQPTRLIIRKELAQNEIVCMCGGHRFLCDYKTWLLPPILIESNLTPGPRPDDFNGLLWKWKVNNDIAS
uniref:Uncharacterized protein n=1 Tax=Globodera rostochiensis TaxID=31243 RepID=A0A914GV69_GLORO